MKLSVPGYRLVTMSRYPLASYETCFTAPFLIMKTHAMSSKKAFLYMPGLYVIASAFMPVVFLPDQYRVWKYIVLTSFVIAWLLWVVMPRHINKLHVYDDKESKMQP